ncbi:M14 family zinc carboxypeptidase [Hymenobacter sp. H14-R3]|uniref:M14 family zinc carboxypeptidase n=1 Tax=Hymenobacter sp. H14-R3 TaxID=3046308 RepID=UPI0024BB4BEB|nr:M14 family zinc carboxypeptidase [Hymenobacter sp. H14-R3]MDJ0365206.1 M14 family zinc carboxypeptidase [Hymenobacter sp. H14-R3]
MFFAYLLLAAALGTTPPPLLPTPFERDPARNTTATYAECIGFYKALAASYPTTMQLREAGPTDSGQPLHELVLSADGTFEPAASRAKGRPVLFIQNGIHPGEPEGIDASMMLARNLLQDNKLRTLLQKVTVVIIPAYNIGGMLNRNSTTRANQNGPREYGFRGNVRHLDLNRDFSKQDSRNARSFAALFGKWRPEVFVDTHTSNGADYQYTITLIPTQPDKLGPELGKYLQSSLLPALYQGMNQKHWPMAPYVDFEGETPESGLRAFLESPRYSTGYAALFNTIGFMPETHMLKAFGPRVQATYDLLLTYLQVIGQQAPALLAARAAADRALATQTQFPLAWALRDTASATVQFRGYEAGHKPSAVSGQPRLYYDRARPYTRPVPYYNAARATATATAPVAYAIPSAWGEVLDNLRRNGVVLRQPVQPLTGPSETYSITDYKTSPRPYEGHYLHSQVKLASLRPPQQNTLAPGTYYLAVLAEQGPARRYLVQALEPQATDSFFAWGFFDSVLQQKEHFSDYVFEDLAATFLTQNPAVRQQLEAAKKADPALAASGPAQLEWVYQHSPYAEPGYRRYPVLRWLGNVD